MKFPVDAHLPPKLCRLLRAAGHEPWRTRNLPAKNLRAANNINSLPPMEKLAAISEDTNLDYSHPRRQPCKPILARAGNVCRCGLKALFARNLAAIDKPLKNSSLMETPAKGAIAHAARGIAPRVLWWNWTARLCEW